MGAAKSAGRIIAVLLLTQMAAYWVMNDVLLRPVFAAPGFLENAAARSTQMGLAALLGLVTGLLSVGIAITALPVFRRYSDATAYGFLALAVASFSVTAVEQINLMSMLSLSQAYAGADAANNELFQTLRGMGAASRNWAHFIGLIVAGSVAFVLYNALYRFALIPRVLAAFGMLAALSQIIAVAMPLFGQRVVFVMIYPLGLSHLALVLWLMAKGFAEHQQSALMAPGPVPR